MTPGAPRSRAATSAGCACSRDLGAPIERGPLSRLGGRRVYFDVDDDPDDLFGNRPAAAPAAANQDLEQGTEVADRLRRARAPRGPECG